MAISELAHSAHTRDTALRSLHKIQHNTKGANGGIISPALRGIENEVRDLKSLDLLEILRIRKLQRETNPSEPSFVEVRLAIFPGEEISEVSQNAIFFNFPNSDPPIPQLNSALDLLARAEGSKDARDIVDILGEPDTIEIEEQHSFLRRTHEEIRRTDRRFKSAEAEGNVEEMTRMDEIKEMLSIRLLKQRIEGAPINCDLFIKFHHGKNRLMIRITIDPDRWAKIPVTSQLIDLVLEGGIWNRIEMDPEEADALLDQF